MRRTAVLWIRQAGTPQVNGLYQEVASNTFRREGSNIGLLLWTDGLWYVSDCGPEFTPAGVDHLDFYTGTGALPDLRWEVGEDGHSPCPEICVLDTFQKIMDALSQRFSPLLLQILCSDEFARPKNEEISDFLTRRVSLKEMEIGNLSAVVRSQEISVFFEFYLAACEELVRRMDTKRVDKAQHPVDEIIAISDLQRHFRSHGGLETADTVKQVYRNVDNLEISDRQRILGRTRLFSAADVLRTVCTGGKLDEQGRDEYFRVFWGSFSKDEDPEKEQKCPVIKEALENDRTAEFQATRERLIGNIARTIDLDTLAKHDCTNNELRLISIHGIVWDVTGNLEKYAPEGEYHFFPGKDITFPMAISSLSDKHANKFYRLTPDMLVRVYGWIAYFEHKYSVYARLVDWDQEVSFPDAPAEHTSEDNAECAIM